MSDPHASVRRDRFGTTAEGTPVDRFTLDNGRGAVVRLISYGAIVTELRVPDRQGQSADVVLGYDAIGGYEADTSYLGATVGRVAFRIPRGRFELDGRTYQLTLNVSPNHLHGGVRGFSKCVWKAETSDAGGEPSVKFTLRSPDGDQGYPGALHATVAYTLARPCALRIDYTATTDRPTPVSMTHHGYFNLSGRPGADVLGHRLSVPARNFAPLSAEGVSVGKFVPVAGTPFDLNEPAALRDRMQPGGETAVGFDNAFLPAHGGGALARVALVYEPQSGRQMEVLSTQPAVVVYTANHFDGTIRGKGGTLYPKHAGLCIEPAHLPNAVNHPEWPFPPVVLRPGQTYQQSCIYAFSTLSSDPT